DCVSIREVANRHRWHGRALDLQIAGNSRREVDVAVRAGARLQCYISTNDCRIVGGAAASNDQIAPLAYGGAAGHSSAGDSDLTKGGDACADRHSSAGDKEFALADACAMRGAAGIDNFLAEETDLSAARPAALTDILMTNPKGYRGAAAADCR